MSNQTTAVIYSKDRTNLNDTVTHFSVDISPPVENAYALSCIGIDIERNKQTNLRPFCYTPPYAYMNIHYSDSSGLNNYIGVFTITFPAKSYVDNIGELLECINMVFREYTNSTDPEYQEVMNRLYITYNPEDNYVYFCCQNYFESPRRVVLRLDLDEPAGHSFSSTDRDYNFLLHLFGSSPNAPKTITENDYLPDSYLNQGAYALVGIKSYPIQGVFIGQLNHQFLTYHREQHAANPTEETVLLLEQPFIFPSKETLTFSDEEMKRLTPVKRILARNYFENTYFHAKSSFDVEWVHFRTKLNLATLRFRIIRYNKTTEIWETLPPTEVEDVVIKLRVLSHPSLY